MTAPRWVLLAAAVVLIPAGAAFELLRRWWVDIARRPVGRWPA